MSNTALTTPRTVLTRLRAISLWHLAGIVILAEIVTACMNTIMGIIWWDQVSIDLILIGTVDALVAALVVGTIVLYIIEQLRETDKNYRELVENANSIILRIDPAGNIIFFNEYAEKFYGFSKDQIMGRNAVGTIVPETDSTGRNLAEMVRVICLDPAKYVTNVNENIKKDGSRAWISWTNKPVFNADGTLSELLCIGSDITQVKQTNETLQKCQLHLEELVAERTAELIATIERLQHEISKRETVELALRESEERFRGIFMQNEDALFIVSRHDCGIIDANQAAISLYGYTQEEFIGGGLPLLLAPLEQEQCRTEIQNSCSAGKFRIARIMTRRKDGTDILASIWGKAVRLRKCEVLFCSFRDITERFRLEEEARLLQAKLIQMNKMSSLGMLVSGIAHEINNPNHFIAVNAQMVSEAWKDAAHLLSDHYREYGDFSLGGVLFSEMRYIMPRLLSAMSEGSERINNIVENLKDFTRQGRIAIDKPVDINKVIISSSALLNSQIGKFTDRFQVREGAGLPQVKGNKQQLEQVVINLIMNALQSLRTRSDAVTVSTLFDNEAEHIKILVSDEGVGIPQDVLNHITEPFYTTRIDEGGTGLGLSISYSIIKDHQGSLTFQSEPGRGTTAIISLPAYKDAAERSRHAPDHIS